MEKPIFLFKPFVDGLSASAVTAAAPELSPTTVTRVGSPLNCLMLRWIHSSANLWKIIFFAVF